MISLYGCYTKTAMISLKNNTFTIYKTKIPFDKVVIDSATYITIFSKDSTELTFTGNVLIK